jgi:hypothetical protein
MLGMHVSLLVGGPEPRKNGQINVIRYFFILYLVVYIPNHFTQHSSWRQQGSSPQELGNVGQGEV